MRPDIATLLVPLALSAVAAAVDLRTRQIPDAIPITVAIWGLIATATGWSRLTLLQLIGGSVLGVIIALLIVASMGFGGGDAKLIAALGLATGATGLLWILAFTALAGGALALLAKARRRSTLAYGPAIAVGLAVYVALLSR